MTKEDHVELVKTHAFMRKHATGKAKIELHVLGVERGMSWECCIEKSKVWRYFPKTKLSELNVISRRLRMRMMEVIG